MSSFVQFVPFVVFHASCLLKKRMEPSAPEALTPLGWRLRATFCLAVLLPLTQGMVRSGLGTLPQRALSGTELLGPLIVMKMLGQWLGDDMVASCQTWPRKSPFCQTPAPP